MAAAVLGPLAQAATLFVDAKAGNDGASGAEGAPFKTIQKAVGLAEAGDTVMVQPGVYFESVQILKRGTKEKPITLKAGAFGLNAVVVTGARADIRRKDVKWELFDKATLTYRIAHKAGFPARVIYDGIDLFPYPTLAMLQVFQSPLLPEPLPRPRHGYTYDAQEGFVYVRLHPDGKYGSTDPNEHVMSVAPEVAGGFEGALVRKPADYTFGILGRGPAFIVIDGFTFETPAVAGVFTEGSDVVVRNCWFRGCRTGVSGDFEEDFFDPAKGGDDFYNYKYSPQYLDTRAARVTVEFCDFTQKPAVADVEEIFASLPPETDEKRLRRGFTRKGELLALWTRKDTLNGGLPSERFKYEIGIACRIGRDWIIRRNHLEDVFEGLSCHAVSNSEGLQILENTVTGACDNAFELEDHSVGVTMRGNVLRNCLEPVSYQPLRGEPWPTSIVIEDNLIYNEPGDIYAKVSFSNGGLKWGITRANWNLPFMKEHPLGKKETLTLPGKGVDIRNNTIIIPGGMVIKNVNGVLTSGYRMHNNVLIAESFIGRRLFKEEYDDTRDVRDQQSWGVLLDAAGNFCAPDRDGSVGPGEWAAGKEGKVFPSVAALAEAPEAVAIMKKAGLRDVFATDRSPGELPAGTRLVAKRFVFNVPVTGPQKAGVEAGR